MEQTGHPLPRRRTRPTRFQRQVLAFVCFAAGRSFVNLSSSPAFPTMVQQCLLPCGVLLTALPFLWLSYTCVLRTRMWRAAGVPRAAMVDANVVFAIYCCFGMAFGLVSVLYISSRILEATWLRRILGLSMALDLASMQLYTFSMADSCLLDPPVGGFSAMKARKTDLLERVWHTDS